MACGRGGADEVGPAPESPTPIRAPQNADPGADPAFTEAQVINVVDGDTIDVLIEGVEYRVRYILVDTPETKHPQSRRVNRE